MQRALLPAARSPIGGCDIAVLCQPVHAIGGDGYDVVRLSDTQLALSIADVAGKGVPAALLLSHVLATTRACVPLTPGPADLAHHLNQSLCRHLALDTFVTACHAVLDLGAGTIVCTNAGHTPPVLVRADGSVTRLVAGGPVLGLLPDAVYEEVELPLRSGDRLLFFTDGVTEACSAEGTEFGEDRLGALVASVRQLSAQRLLDTVFAGVCAFSRSLDDDVALMVVAID
jgi:phosphoserine phosphatase RsbU/P